MKPLNVKEVFTLKNPGLAKKIPNFVYRWIHNFFHLDELNEILVKLGDRSGFEAIEMIFDYFQVTYECRGVENIPSEGRYIVVANHPLGAFDGLTLLASTRDYLGYARILSRDETSQIPPLRELFIPINKFGNQRASIQLINEAYESDYQVLLFPAGLTSRKIKGKITDLEWQKHFVQKAIEHKRDVIPVHISGRCTNLFYTVAKIRNFLRIKFNIEVFLMPKELIKARGTKVVLTFGKPIPWQQFDHTKTQTEWAADVRSLIYTLPATQK